MAWQLINIFHLTVLLSFYNSIAFLILLVKMHMVVAINSFGKSSKVRFLIKNRGRLIRL